MIRKTVAFIRQHPGRLTAAFQCRFRNEESSPLVHLFAHSVDRIDALPAGHTPALTVRELFFPKAADQLRPVPKWNRPARHIFRYPLQQAKHKRIPQHQDLLFRHRLRIKPRSQDSLQDRFVVRHLNRNLPKATCNDVGNNDADVGKHIRFLIQSPEYVGQFRSR